MSSILVIGGAGFIGSNLTEHLLNKSYNIKVLDNLNTGIKKNISFLDKNDFYDGDIRDFKVVESCIKDVDYIFHQAALPSVPRSVKAPIESSECNIMGTLNVLDAARKADVKRIIYASSSSVYGDTEELPKKETMPMNPLSPYAVTKVSMEYFFDVFNKVYGIESVGLRYFNVYGPRQNIESEYAAVIPKFINSIIKGDRPVIYGDGEQTRDFTFVEDVVQANILAMTSKNIKHNVFNIARGEAISINQLVDKINNVLCKNIEPNYSEKRKGDILHSFADISKANDILGYNPRYDIENGLKKTIKWFRENHV